MKGCFMKAILAEGVGGARQGVCVAADVDMEGGSGIRSSGHGAGQKWHCARQEWHCAGRKWQ
eukprot:2788477-Pleurochrysis_carterae.AAC.1